MDIHLNFAQKEQWKQQCKALLKKSGRSQQEVAEEMAKIVANRENTDVVSTAFISSLSRFINAKGTAFPSWFEQEEERLLPLAHAMKLSSTTVFWDIISQITSKVTHVAKVHPAFPHMSFSISCLVSQKNSGTHKNIPHILAQHENISKIYIVGTDALQRYWAIQEIQRYCQEGKLVVPSIIEQHTTQQHLLPSDKMDIAANTLMLFLDNWGIAQVQQAIDQLLVVSTDHSSEDVQTSQRLLLQQVREHISEELVAIDSSPTALLWMIYDISQQGNIPTLQQQIARQYQREFIESICAHTTIENLALSELEFLVYRLLFTEPAMHTTGWSTKDMERWIESTITLPTVQLSQQRGISLLETIEFGDKKQKKEAMDILRQSFLTVSTTDILRALEQEELLLQENNRWYVHNIDLCLMVVVEGLVQGRSPMDRHGKVCLIAESLIVQDIWWKFVWLSSVMGVSYFRFNQILQSFSPYMYIDIARSRLLFWTVGVSDTTIIESYPEYLEDWAFVVWMESLSIFPYRTKHNFCQSLPFLQQFSFKYVSVLPKIHSWQDIWRLGIPKIRMYGDFANIQYPHIRNIWSVVPYQMAPTSMAEWEEWQISSSLDLWKVLDAHARVGCLRSARLVSEGEGKNHLLWQQIPVDIRLHWMGTVSVQPGTLQAFQSMILDHWNPETNSIFLSTAKNIGFSTVLNWMGTWMSPLFILQYHKDSLGLRLARASIAFAIFFEAYDLLEQWIEDALEWMEQENLLQGKFVTWRSRRIVVQENSEEACVQLVGAIVLEGSTRLAEKHRPQLLWNLYQMSQKRNTKAVFLSMQQQSKMALLECNHVDLIAEWLGHKRYDREIEKRALLDISFLTLLWKLDVYAQRRSEIVRIAALHHPIPMWLIALARKSVLQEKRWPQWLSPFAVEAQHLVLIILETAQYLDKLWWLHCVKISTKTYGPYISDILQEISVWVKQPDRMSIQMKHVYYLADNSTPRFDALDICNMLQEMMVEDERVLQHQWLQEAMVDIWKELLRYPTFNRQRSNIAMTVYQIIHKMGIQAQLIQENWWQIDPVLVDQLISVWFDITTEIELVSYVEHPVLGHRVCVFLLQKENSFVIEWVQQCVIAEKFGILEYMLQNSDGAIQSYVWKIIDTVITKHPQLKKAIGTILLKSPMVWKEPSGQGLLWLRSIFADG